MFIKEELNQQAETKTADQQNAQNDNEQKEQETKTDNDVKEQEVKTEKSELEIEREKNARLVDALNQRALQDVLVEMKIDPTKAEWVKKINAELFNTNEPLDAEKLKNVLKDKSYDSIRVFNGLEAKSSLSNVFTSNQQIKSNPQVDVKTQEKKSWDEFIAKFKGTKTPTNEQKKQ